MEPVSRFWACFFAASIFAPLWTQKMKKTRRWILLIVPLNFIMYFGYILVGVGMNHSDLLYFSPGSRVIGLVPIFSWILTFAALLYLMFGWTTQYNMDNFGVCSRKEWKRRDPAPGPDGGTEPGRP